MTPNRTTERIRKISQGIISHLEVNAPGDCCHRLIEKALLSEREAAIRECADKCDLMKVKKVSSHDEIARCYNTALVHCRDGILGLLETKEGE